MPCRPHLDFRFRVQVLRFQSGQRKVVDLAREDCDLIENHLGGAGFVYLIPLKPGETDQDGDGRREETKDNQVRTRD